jgi:hypothetical protein
LIVEKREAIGTDKENHQISNQHWPDTRAFLNSLWDTSSVMSVTRSFKNATLLNQIPSQWDASIVYGMTNMFDMFDRATSFQ